MSSLKCAYGSLLWIDWIDPHTNKVCPQRAAINTLTSFMGAIKQPLWVSWGRPLREMPPVTDGRGGAAVFCRRPCKMGDLFQYVTKLNDNNCLIYFYVNKNIFQWLMQFVKVIKMILAMNKYIYLDIRQMDESNHCLHLTQVWVAIFLRVFFGIGQLLLSIITLWFTLLLKSGTQNLSPILFYLFFYLFDKCSFWFKGFVQHTSHSRKR